VIPSKYIEEAVNAMASLPGVGRKTALRYVLHMLSRSEEDVEHFAKALVQLRTHLKRCKVCQNVSDFDICAICSNPQRDNSTICVVEDVRDVMAIESTHQYKGLYHVLGGRISPMEGIGPGDLSISPLIGRLTHTAVKELILALSPTMEGDTTAFYIYRKVPAGSAFEITTLTRGVAVGDELQYTDEVTLGRSIALRTPYQKG
jgi:recombination protein RecR